MRPRLTRLLLSGVSTIALLTGTPAMAGDILRGNSAASPVTTPTTQQTVATQQAAEQAARAKEMMSRTAEAVRQMQAAQEAARAAALAAVGTVADGLEPGGLVIAPGATPGSLLWQGAEAPTETEAGGRTKVEIEQTQEKAILTWEQFNVGKETDLYFNQKAGGDDAQHWIALNRVLDPSGAPSQILGNLKADGQVYIINKNGILFGGASQLDTHTLVASTLSLSNEQFMKGIMAMLFIDTNGGNGFVFPTFGESAPNQTVRNFVPSYVPGDVIVEAGADIKMQDGGKALLFGSHVTNSGHIAAPDGQVILGAGEQIYLIANPTVRGLDILTSAVPTQMLLGRGDPAAVLNAMSARAQSLDFRVVNDGVIQTERGNITLQGRSVDQFGLLTATTALNNQDGSIRLRAWDGGTFQICSDSCLFGLTHFFAGTVTLGPDSVTQVLPDVTDTSLIELSALATRYQRSSIELRGKLIDVQDQANILAPAGKISIVAATNPARGQEEFGTGLDTSNDGSRVYIGSEAFISAAGILDASVPIDRNIVRVELFINELQDSPLLRESFLRGQREIYVDRRLTGRFTEEPFDTVQWFRDANGEFDPGLWFGSPIGNLSGWLANSKTDLAELSTLGGEIFIKAGGDVITRANSLLDVSGGSIKYEGGLVHTTKLVGADGRVYDIGNASPDRIYLGFAEDFIDTHSRWGVVETHDNGLPGGGGEYQPGYTEGRAAGSMKIYAGSGFAIEGRVRGDVVVGEKQRSSAPAAGSIQFGGSSDPERPYAPDHLVISNIAPHLADDFTATTALGPDFFQGAASKLFLTPDFISESGMRSVASVTASTATVAADADIQMRAKSTLSLGLGTVTFDGKFRSAGGTFSSGATNLGATAVIDVSGAWVNDLLDPAGGEVAINGGSLVIGGLSAQAGAVLDVSAGGWVRSAGDIDVLAGNAGTVSLNPSASLDLNSLDLRAYAAGSGGTLQILTGSRDIQIGGDTAADGVLHLPASLFADRGFSSFSVDGRNILVPDGATVAPVAVGVEFGADVASIASGAHITDAGMVKILRPEERITRSPASILLRHTGTLHLGLGAVLRTDVGGAISTLGGIAQINGVAIPNDVTIAGTIEAPAGSIDISGVGGVTLESTAQLLTRGASVISESGHGLRNGVVLSGGSVIVDADAFLSAEEGSLIDVSGTSGEVDYLADGGAVQTATLVSDGGSITFRASQWGGAIDSTLLAQAGGAGASGGSLLLANSVVGSVSNTRVPTSLYYRNAAGQIQRYTNPTTGDLDLFNEYQSAPLLMSTAMRNALNGYRADTLGSILIAGDVSAHEAFATDGTIARRPWEAVPVAATTNMSIIDPRVVDLLNRYFWNGTGTSAANFQLTTPIVIPDQVARSLTITDSAINNGGFANVSMTSTAGLTFSGSATVQALESINAAAGTIRTTADAQGTLVAPYVRLAAANNNSFAAPGSLSGQFLVDARYIDIDGIAGTSGVADTILRAAKDIRLNGTGATTTLHADGQLTLEAGQIYPSTGVTARIESPTSIRIEGNGNATQVPLSAGGSLTIEAPVIEQFGTVRAPMGQLVLRASTSLTLGEDSLTSVSAEGAIIPYGFTINNENWYYGTSTSLGAPLSGPPAKRLSLEGTTVDVQDGAVIDITGGGDLFAREFVAGPGGSRDILNQPGVFAIIPGYASELAPYDRGVTGETQRSYDVPSAGQTVYLAGGNGLEAGYYTLLPPTYALLPGAFLISSVGEAGFATPPSTTLPDGSLIMTGRRGNALSGASAQQAETWRVMSGATVRSYSEYFENYANKFFASDQFKQTMSNTTGATIVTPRLPIDGGTLVLKAAQDLILDGTVRSQAGEGGRGGLVDITAAKLAVVGAGYDTAALRADGYLVLDSGKLTDMGAASLLLGGTRSDDPAGVRVDVAASNIVVRNDEETALEGSEIILAAKENLTVEGGSVIRAEGEIPADSSDLIVAPQVPEIINTSTGVVTQVARDWGALLRVSNGAAVNVRRQGAESSNGVLTVGAGAILSGGAALTLDATKDTTVAAGAILSGADVSLASGRIGIGGGTSGLVIDSGALDDLASAQRLRLASYSTIDFYDSASLTSSTLELLSLDAGALVAYGSGNVQLDAKRIELANTGATFSEPAGTGNSTLTLGTEEIILAGGDKRLRGFATAGLTAQTQVTGRGEGSLDAGTAAVSVTAPLVTGESGASQSIRTDGAFVLASNGTAAAEPQGIGARFAFTGGSVTLGSTIRALGGVVSATATSGDLLMSQGALIDVGGFRKDFFDVTAYGDAGTVNLTSLAGSVRVNDGASVNVAAHAEGGNAGALNVAAVGGVFELAGTVVGNAVAGNRSGTFTLDAATVSDFGALSAKLNEGGFFEERSFRVRSGDVLLDGTTKARKFSLEADQGSVTITGTIDASSDRGGHIAISAQEGLAMLGGAQLLARNTGEFGTSRVLLETQGANGGTLDIAGGLIDVTSPGGGRVKFRAPQIDGGTDVAVTQLGATIAGANEAEIEGFAVYNSATTSGVHSQAVADAIAFAGQEGAIQARLGRSDIDVTPGIEIRSTGDLAVDSDWNLFADFAAARQGGLVLRAAGNINVTGNLSDGFSLAGPTGAVQTGGSWDIGLVAGADLAGASALRVQPLGLLGANGNITVGTTNAAALVRTGTGDLSVRAGNGLTLAHDASVLYTAGERDTTTYDGFIPHSTAVFAKGGGNLDIAVGGDIVAAISNQFTTDWLWRRGEIESSGVYQPGRQPAWWVMFGEFRQGVGALGGGDVSVEAGGSLSNLSVSQPTMGRVTGGLTLGEEMTAHVQNGGLMNVEAGGDISGGTFYAGRGEADISAATFSIGRTATYTDASGNGRTRDVAPILGLGDTVMKVRSSGNMTIQTATDMLMAPMALGNRFAPTGNTPRFLTYTDRTSLDLVSTGGDVLIANQVDILRNGSGTTAGNAFVGIPEAAAPALLHIAALSGSVVIDSNGVQGAVLAMAPGKVSDLTILAEKDVKFVGLQQSRLPLSEMPQPTKPWYITAPSFRNELPTTSTNIRPERNPDELDIIDDFEPSRIYARTGSIQSPVVGSRLSVGAQPYRQAQVWSNEAVWLRAGKDIRGLILDARNNHPSDVTLLEAGNDIVMTPAGGTTQSSIRVRGPGALILQAGRDVVMAPGIGLNPGPPITTTGNVVGTDFSTKETIIENALPEGGASIEILVGIKQSPNYDGFVAAYLDPANVGAMPGYLTKVGPGGTLLPAYFFDERDDRDKIVRRGLISYVEQTTGTSNLTPEEAWAAFQGLSEFTQQVFIRRILAQEIRETNRANAGLPLNTQDHERAYSAIELLFPEDQDWSGDIIGNSSVFETSRGGDIDMFAPGGRLQVTALGSSRGGAVVTSSYGDVRIFTRDSVTVNIGRILTFEGGDVMIGSLLGDIDAGRGAKTVRSNLAPEVFIDLDGNTLVIERADQAGSGIGTVEGFAGIEPGDVDLWAPKGIVNAGDAGIRVSGNLFISAIQVLGADNIDVAGEVKGIPVDNTPDLHIETGTGAENAATDAAGMPKQTTDLPSLITVEVLGYGESNGETLDEAERARRKEEEERRKREQQK